MTKKYISVEETVKNMTLEEKVAQMQQIADHCGKNTIPDRGTIGSYLFTKPENKARYAAEADATRLGVRPILGIDAIHGHACLKGSTVFPTQISLACSFDEELIEEIGVATAREVAADGHHWVFSPVLCMARDLRWGRVGETFGEDTELISRLGAAIIKGYQKDGLVAACAKHYLAYGEATGGRDAYDTQITERRAREVLLPPFKAAVDAGCHTFMTAYGSIDASPITTSHRWMTEILKDELGFDGFAVTDWTNVEFLVNGQHAAENLEEATAAAINAGNDMSMQVSDFYDALLGAVRKGLVSEERINDAVTRILKVKEAIGLLDENTKRPDLDVIGCDEHKALNHRAALESNVLLGNDGILPLQGVKKLAVVGPNADDIKAQYGDWTYFTHPANNPNATPKDDVVTVLRGLRENFDGEVLYAKGVNVTPGENDGELIEEALEVAKSADVVIAVIGDDTSYNGEWKDRANPTIPGRQIELVEKLAALGKKVIVVMINGRALMLNEVKKHAAAIIESFSGGDLGGLAVAELILGKANFSGRLPISIPTDAACAPTYYNQYDYWHTGGGYIDRRQMIDYPFGYGLSYSSFNLSDVTLSECEVKIGEKLTLSVEITNTSEIDGTDIIQLYYRDTVCKMLRPVRTLIDFKRVAVKAGEGVRVQFEVDSSKLGYLDEKCNYTVDEGEIKFFVSDDGRSFKEAKINLKK